MNSNFDPSEINSTNDIRAIVAEIYRRYDEKKASKNVVEILNKLRTGKNYREIYNYIRELGFGDILKEYIDTQIYLESREDYKVIADAFIESCRKYSEDINDLSEIVQKSINDSLGIRIKPQRIGFNKAGVAALINDYIEKPEGESLVNSLITYGAELTDSIIKANADIQSQSGFKIVVIRAYDDRGVGGKHGKYGDKYLKSCTWCLSRQGAYNYDDLDKNSEVWQRHKGCSCSIDYVNQGFSTRVQNYT